MVEPIIGKESVTKRSAKFGDSYYFKASVAQVIAKVAANFYSHSLGYNKFNRHFWDSLLLGANPVLNSGIPLCATLLNSIPVFG